MVKSKIRYKVKNWISQIRLYLGFPQIWVFAIIFILAVLMFILSLFVENEYWSTLAGNIFAGLITGMVISLIAGTKQIYIVKQEMLHSWLAELHKQIMDFYEMRNKFLRRDYGDMAREDFIYDMGPMLIGLTISFYKGHSIKYCHLILSDTVKIIMGMTLWSIAIV